MPTLAKTIEYDVDVEFEVWCACGAGLCKTVQITYHDYTVPSLEVGECQACIDRATKEGHEEGYEKGVESLQEELEELRERIRELTEDEGL